MEELIQKPSAVWNQRTKMFWEGKKGREHYDFLLPTRSTAKLYWFKVMLLNNKMKYFHKQKNWNGTYKISYSLITKSIFLNDSTLITFQLPVPSTPKCSGR